MAHTINNKYNAVTSTLRREIIEGIYAPGRRLPTRAELGDRFGVGIGTVQRALVTLTEDGFVHSRPKAGTFVTENPPHLCNYALLCPSSGLWSRYYLSLREAAKTVAAETSLTLEEYDVSNQVKSRDDVARLSRDIDSSRLAGLIFAGPADELDINPLLNGKIPNVFLHYGNKEIPKPAVLIDENDFLDKALGYMRSQGRRRVAHLRIEFPWEMVNQSAVDIKARGFEVKPYWIQGIPTGTLVHTAANVVHLMMRLQGEDKPDALIIYDDNLVDHAVAGLVAAGVKVPQDVEVLVKCNYPSPVSSVVPITLLGLDCCEVLRNALKIIDMQRNGQQPPDMLLMKTIFADKLNER